ncbi:UNVERIFIED_CONTAM: G-type lectin S-receptor-like serine/threonine-protein kinase [Sesamum radiatum]|uniref:non-specific serine/threonine protein kinase n=1 Tax=Sesamum radiatum TaxID=300843 RepID=A0AAW2RCF6_SESRA
MVPENEHILTKWARENISKGKVDEIVDSSLRGEISEGSLKAFVEVAEKCLLDEPKKRPTMAQVVLQLEFALEQQESKQLLVLNEISRISDDIHPCNDESGQLVQTGQLTMASTDVQNFIPHPKEQGNSKAVSIELPSGRIATMYKPSQLRPWDAFWNRIKPSKKKELLLSDEAQQRRRLQWPVCFNIIMGIARGLLYLHQDSGLKIIHGSIESSTILLDAQMNPKISDFDFARTWEDPRTEDTTVVFGNIGYMSPEYYLEARLFLKSDVYSFGITVLEIVTGKKVLSYRPNEEPPTVLVDYAWKLWKEGKAAEVVDESVLTVDAFAVEEAIRCVQVALLCTEEEHNRRPEMSSVIRMLEGEEEIAEPQKPWCLTWLQF